MAKYLRHKGNSGTAEAPRSLYGLRSQPHTLRTQQEPHCQRVLSRNPLPPWLVKGETLAMVASNPAARTADGDLRAEFLHLHVDDLQPQVEMHRLGGRVWAEGESTRGATFSFALPTAQRGTER